MPHFYISEDAMKAKARVLVMGATGQVGCALVARLVADEGVKVVAAARTSAKAKHLGVEVVEFDLDRVDTLAPALRSAGATSAPGESCTHLIAFKLIPSSELEVSVQDLAHLYAAFARDRLDGGKTSRNFSDAVAMHTMIDAIYEASSFKRTLVPKEQS